jgi:mRNA-degrading endonuclease RelE of RelBE toxin-antitoxin system
MNLNKSWDLLIDDQVHRILKKFPPNYAKKILGVIKELPNDPRRGDVKKIKSERYTWRKRVGDYRIFFRIFQQRNTIYVFWVERRGSKTYS